MRIPIIGAVLAAIIGAVFVLPGTASAGAGGGGIGTPPGNPLYVIVEVTWDGNPLHAGSWTPWGPRWDPVVGGVDLGGCAGGSLPSSCLDMSTSYQFSFIGKTLQFDETYVSTVDGSPQVHHVVLSDVDGDGTYTGSLSSAKYVYNGLDHDRIDYTIQVDPDGNIVSFRYLEYEHRKLQ